MHYATYYVVYCQSKHNLLVLTPPRPSLPPQAHSHLCMQVHTDHIHVPTDRCAMPHASMYTYTNTHTHQHKAIDTHTYTHRLISSLLLRPLYHSPRPFLGYLSRFVPMTTVMTTPPSLVWPSFICYACLTTPPSLVWPPFFCNTYLTLIRA